MFDLFKMTDGTSNQKLVITLGLTTGVLIMVHYYHQIKLARIQIKEHEMKYQHTLKQQGK